MKMLVPIDFSDYSREAARAAVRLAQRLGGEITLFHVYDYPAYVYLDGGFLSPELEKDLGARTDSKLSAWRAELEAPKVPIALERVRGVPWEEIVRRATDGGFDLVVMATHGRTGIARVLVGSVAEKVVRHATCDVLVVRKRPG